MRRSSIIFFFLLILSFELKAQDAQRSQYYSVPLELNPAYTGTSDYFSTYFNYRVQYPDFEFPYTGYHFSGDYHFRNRLSGMGISFNNDKVGPEYLTTTKLHLLYATGVKLNRKFSLRMGLKAGLISRKLDFDELIYADQIDANGNVNGPSAENIEGINSKVMPSVGSGILLFHEKYWFGISADHINNPKQSFITNESKLDPKFVFQAGYKFAFINAKGRVKKGLKEVSISPMVHYKLQGPSHQWDMGVYAIIEPVLLGVWYRGIPLPSFEREGIINQDALIFLAGIKMDNLVFSYSYDLGIGDLANSNKGSHELTASLKFGFYRNGIIKSYPKTLPMPIF